MSCLEGWPLPVKDCWNILLFFFKNFCSHIYFVMWFKIKIQLHDTRVIPSSKRTSWWLAVTPSYPLLSLCHYQSMDLPFLTFHTDEIMQYVAFCVRLLSFNMMSSRLTRVVAIHRSLLRATILCYVNRPQFVQSSVGGCLCCFCSSVIVI